jgi:hypothetical protein
VGARLSQNLEMRLLQSYLRLELKELQEEEMQVLFNEARRMVEKNSLHLFDSILRLSQEFTSIAAQVATLASLTTKHAWPVLALTAVSPIIDYTISMFPSLYLRSRMIRRRSN